MFVLAYHRTYGLPVTVSRCSNNYGPYHFPGEADSPLLSAAPWQMRSFLYTAQGRTCGTGSMWRITARPLTWLSTRDARGKSINIGGHNERTNLEVVKTILKALDKPESLIKFVTDRPGHDMRYAIDPTKIETELGWKPTYNFDTGIEQTIRWYLDNQDWWKNILSGEYSNYFDKMYGSRL